MQKKLALLAGCAALMSTNAFAVVTHADAIAATCMSCHGTDGKSKGAIPPLAGLDKAYIVKSLNEFKAGARPSMVMQKYATGYTEAEYEAVAEIFSKMK